MAATLENSLAGVELEMIADRCVNVAMQQNDIPVIKRLRIQHPGQEALEDLELSISAEPAFVNPYSRRIAAIAPGTTHELAPVDLQLSPAFLFGVSERTNGTLNVRLACAGAVIERTLQIELLAYNEWGGLRGLPEILAAFVLPNDPQVSRLLKQAGRILEEWGESSAISGYQSASSRHVALMTAAIYEALLRCNITYVSPPASFQTTGQKVRLPSRILDERLATCLDITLLFCACLEQAGLHPLIILKKDHAFAGVWLQQTTFPVAAIDEMTSLKKRIELNEILVFEPTALTAGVTHFEQVVDRGRRHFDTLSQLQVAIDVRRARIGRILPLPCLSDPAGEPGQAPDASAATSAMPVFDLPDTPDEPASPAAEPVESRLQHWQNKLLDLSLRNRLLNFRETRKTLPILCSSLADLEDGLAEGGIYQLLPKPTEHQGRDTRLHHERTGEDPLESMLAEQLAQGRIHAAVPPKELDHRLLELYRGARTGAEETGVSGLFLALGFLRWYETEHADAPRRAPILLLPISLTRASVNSGFRLQRNDDDPRINVTLLELLKRDFDLRIPGLTELPEDEAGLDVPRILNLVRRAVRDLPRWEVEEEACVGMFLFTKFMMWLDLCERLELLKRNPVVAHLTDSPSMEFQPGASFPQPAELDDSFTPDRVHCPLGADSTQLAAVLAGADGKSFVLQGPPGTGKSHTITNLVGHCLAAGKTVLFVSEKMAALNVVRSRLEWLGLGPFCLELHSNKASKKEVLRQFEEALAFGPRQQPAQWAAEARSIAELRGALNTFVRALHLPHRNGWTAFEAVAELVRLREVTAVELLWPTRDAHTADEFRELTLHVEELAIAAGAVGCPANNPWFPLDAETFSVAWQRDLQTAVAESISACRQVQDKSSAVLEALGLDLALTDRAQVDALQELSRVLAACPELPPGLLRATNWTVAEADIARWVAWGRRAAELRAALEAEYELDLLLQQPLATLKSTWQLSAVDWLLMRWIRQRPIRKLLKAAHLPGVAVTLAPLDVLRMGEELQGLLAKLEGEAQQAQVLLAPAWRAESSDWTQLEAFGNHATALRKAITAITLGDVGAASQLCGHLAKLLDKGPERFGPESGGGRLLQVFCEAATTWQKAWQRLLALGQIRERRMGRDQAQGFLAQVEQRLLAWQNAWDLLRDWCVWRRLAARAAAAGLDPLLKAHERGDISATELPAVFLKGYLEWWYNATSDAEPALRDFSSTLHEHKIAKFRDLDESYHELTRQLIIARLSSRLPTETGAHPNSELGKLRREIQKKSRHISIRKLLEQCPGIVPRLKPCMLMSPLSVAQYLGSGYPPFDLVVFDEASQIPVWDAIGAIGRGNATIVVGDPKQLPPTSFFSRIDDQEAATDDFVEDLESILDECIAGGLKELQLGWHYRSRHESLISFSNHHYYNNRLLTFPSADNDHLGVRFIYLPEGIYDRSKSRTNRIEAELIVADIVQRLKHRELRQQSIGVVTFSQAQQGLIEDLLDRERADDPSLEFAFSDEARERLFIKNLENVQGDERDVILFSICYGPDAEGRVAMNFGPLNQTGGERRLNVAITRARRSVHVYSSLRADQIDLTRTQAVGVQHLRAFLEYADRGPQTLGSELSNTGGGWDSPLEKQIGEALAARGWRIHRQVGCSGYRLDIAVMHPQTPGRYLLGIECDGAAYHSAASARDRDKLRQSVLEGLGWRIHRIWSTDWWLNRERELDKVDALLQELAAAPVAAPLAAPAPRAEPPPPPAPAEPVAMAEASVSLPAYESFDGAPFGHKDGFDSAVDNRLRAALDSILEAEAPIAHELLVRRVADGWQLSRLTKARRQRIEALLPTATARTRESGSTTFYWLKHQDPAMYRGFRVHAEGDTFTRRIEEICYEELANAANYVLQTQGSLPPEDLAVVVARLFNCNRLSGKAREHLLVAIEQLASRRQTQS